MLRCDRNHNLHLLPFLRWTSLDSLCASTLGLYSRDIAFVNPLLNIFGAAVGRIGEQRNTFIWRKLRHGGLRIPKVSLLRWAAVATSVV